MAIPGLESIGVSPFLAIQLVLAVYALLYWHKHGLVIPGVWKNFTFWFLAFALISVVSAFTLPFLFDGMRIYTPKGGLDQQYLAPGVLEFSFSNVAQAVYLLLYVTGILIFITRYSTPVLKALTSAYLFSGITVCFFSYYQLLSYITGIYYPNEFLYSNENFDLAGDRSISFLPRIYSTFSESSFYSIFMASFLAWVYIRFLNETDKSKTRRWLILLIGTIFSLLISAASTGYATITIFFAVHTISSLFLRTGPIQKRRITALLLSFALILVAIYFVVPEADKVMNEIVFNKGASESSRNRFESDRFAFGVLFETHLLGAGLGSNRPSSAIALLVSNVGILGTACVGIAMFILFIKAYRVARLPSADTHYKVTCQATGWALFVMFLAKALGGPDLNFAPMWILIGYFILSVMKLESLDKESRLKSDSHR